MLNLTFGVIFLGIPSLVMAKFLSPLESGQENSEQMLVVVGAIRQELGLPELKPEVRPEDKKEKNPGPDQDQSKKEEKVEKEKVKEAIKGKEETKNKVSGKVSEKPDILKGLGKGEEKVQAALAKNREILRAQKMKAKEDENSPDKSGNIYQQWHQQVQNTYQGWQDKVNETYAHWREEREKFLKRLPQIKANLIEVPKLSPEEKQSLLQSQNNPSHPSGKKSNSSKNSKHPKKEGPLMGSSLQSHDKVGLDQEGHIILGAMLVGVRDQGHRPTCSAFAGIRAIEILLAQSGKYLDLSEQYFYWASKPQCQNTPCTVKGSWVKQGFLRGQEIKELDIPYEKECPYKDESESGNETQTPLAPTCLQGRVRVAAFRELNTLEEIVDSLNENIPVVAGFTLSDNFFDNRGLVLEGESKGGVNTDREHAQGHAVLLIGHMTMPEKYWSTEGKRCFLTANSWGEGWGKGGHACLSENWVRHFRFPNPFVALTSVEVRDDL